MDPPPRASWLPTRAQSSVSYPGGGTRCKGTCTPPQGSLPGLAPQLLPTLQGEEDPGSPRLWLSLPVSALVSLVGGMGPPEAWTVVLGGVGAWAGEVRWQVTCDAAWLAPLWGRLVPGD